MRKLFLIFAAAALVAYTVPAFAAEWSFNFVTTMDTFWESTSKEAVGGDFDDDEFVLELDDMNWGARIKTDYGVSGQVEVDMDVGLRHAYGNWDFGAGILTVGKTNGLINTSCANCNMRHGAATDGLYESRIPQVGLTFGNLKVAMLENHSTTRHGQDIWTVVADDLVDWAGYDDTKVSLPKFEVQYKMNLGPAAIQLVGGYSSFEYIVQNGTECGYDVDAWVVGLGAAFGFGPATIKATVSQSQNGSVYGLTDEDPLYPVYLDEKIYDVDRLGWQLAGTYAVSDMITLGAGYGASEAELDIEGVKVENPYASWYLVADFTVAKGVRISPEYHVIDYDEIKIDGETEQEGDYTLFGVRWEIEF